VSWLRPAFNACPRPNLAVRLGIDFGTSNTVLALWDESRRDVETLRLPSYGSAYDQAGQRIWIVPSVIHYAADGASWIGDQVIQRNLYSSAQTFRWMKQHIARENPNQKAIGSRRIDARQAGAEFLTTVLTVARDQAGLTDEEVAFTLPVESFERYEDWLAGVAENAGLTRYRLIDESSAAALGYAANIQPNDAYLIFDFGAGTLDVSVVQIDEESTSVTGRRCRTLGKAGKDLGGNAIDMWLYQELLKRNQRSPADEDVRKVSNYLLAECEAAKIRLSSETTSSVTHVDPPLWGRISHGQNSRRCLTSTSSSRRLTQRSAERFAQRLSAVLTTRPSSL
jgi:molecular chaperone DnaK